MADKRTVEALLDEIFDSETTPEEVCEDCPELLPEIRQRWQQMCIVEAKLQALFPTSGVTPEADMRTVWQPGAVLPSIPGYEVEDVLGRGGMGIVYKARQVRLNRPVALKMLLGGVYATSEERDRFAREAEAIAALRHTNIVQIYDVGDHGNWPFFAMEYVEGGSLAEELLGRPQPARQAAALMITLTEAVQAAHRGGIVHRDLKPANILLTTDGTPKIADFGLARHFDAGPTLTLSGARLGTPSYMAPEQALGKTHAIGPPADIYALGALLYELLTGRPPFRGESAAETERQVISEDPVRPAWLNPKVPRDLETICLQCLHKDPERRYATAAALADDLKRFQRGEPVAARPAGLAERAGKWARRRPTHAVILALSLLLMVALLCAGLWFVVQQNRQRSAIAADLRDVIDLQGSARWSDAQAALERAAARLGWAGPDDLRELIDHARLDLDLLVQLDGIRLKRVTRGELPYYKAQASQDYAQVFERAGLRAFRDPPRDVADIVNASPVRGALMAAVYDWAICAAAKAERDWLLELSRCAETKTGAWRERALDPAVWQDPSALAELAGAAPVATEPVSLLLALGERLALADEDATPLLQRVQIAHPADFWANLILGNRLLQGAPKEAAGYYRAALASRPQAAVGYCAVGDALRLQNGFDEAIDYYHKALELDPGFARAYDNLGLTLQTEGRVDEAVMYCRMALEHDPDYAWAHDNLANALRMKGQLEEASRHYRRALELDPEVHEAEAGIRGILVSRGHGAEVQAAWRKELEAHPTTADRWYGYAELCLFLGQEEEYRRACRQLLDRFGSTTNPWLAEPTGRACLLATLDDDERDRAAALVDQAVAAEGSIARWIYRYFLFAQGLAEYRRGHFSRAIALLQGEAGHVMGPCPRLLAAMAQHRLGQQKEALRSLGETVVAFDWSSAQADSRDVWIAHILRREAETLILSNLPAFLEGTYWPQDDDERRALVGVCQSRGFDEQAARLYAELFASAGDDSAELAARHRRLVDVGNEQPLGRLEDLAAACRYPAVRCAALVGIGQEDADGRPSDDERARWRALAREWLRADLAVWKSILESGSRPGRILARKALTRWQYDDDLAGLREPRALEKLSSDERNGCRALWQEVSDLLERACTSN
ncbi:MAG TPA: serine/threonine-protein kinase [Pirellulales bacterium]|nr:serine/threonine-protein kinase [Pirellulales bacterium]